MPVLRSSNGGWWLKCLRWESSGSRRSRLRSSSCSSRFGTPSPLMNTSAQFPCWGPDDERNQYQIEQPGGCDGDQPPTRPSRRYAIPRRDLTFYAGGFLPAPATYSELRLRALSSRYGGCPRVRHCLLCLGLHRGHWLGSFHRLVCRKHSDLFRVKHEHVRLDVSSFPHLGQRDCWSGRAAIG